MMNKKRRLTYGFFIFLLCLGLVYIISRSFAYEVITKTDSNTTNPNAIVKNEGDTADYAYFSITKQNSNDIIGGVIKIKVDKAYSTVNSTTLKAKVEYSANNSTYETYGDTNLTVNGEEVVYEVLELPYTKTYFRISLYNSGVQLKLNKRNIDCKITVTSTTARVSNYTSSGTSTFNVTSDGLFRMELWGAAGNYNPSNMQDQVGAGAYTKGEIKLRSGDTFYINVGEQKTNNTFGQASFNASSSGSGAKDLSGNTISSCGKGGDCSNSSGGGGATDIRLVNGTSQASLESRIMVAAGGGGNVYYKAGQIVGLGGNAGGLVGYNAGTYGNYYGNLIYNTTIFESDGVNTSITTDLNKPHDYAFGGTQKQGGVTNYDSLGEAGTFGKGGSGNSLGAGGGGGYYGGAGGGQTKSYNGSPSGYTPGAGGSSFIAGHTGSIAYQMRNDGRCNESTNGSGSLYRPENYVGTTANACSVVTVGSRQYAFNNTLMIDGKGYTWTNKRSDTMEMPAPPTGGTATYGSTVNGVGNIGGGAARITYVDSSLSKSTATWNKKSTIHIYVSYKDMNGNNISSSIDRVYDPEVNYCYYGPTDGSISHRTVNHVDVTPQGYDVCGITADEDIHITYYYEWDSHNVITMYLDKYFNYDEIENAKIDEYRHGSTYSTSCKTIPYYTFIESEGSSLSGTVDGDKVIRCLYGHRTSKITVNYLEDGTNTVLSQPTVINKLLGDDYDVTPLSILNYAYVRVSGLEHGVCNDENITITYYYRVQESDIYVNHVDCVTGEVLSPQERVSAQAGQHYDVTDRIKRNLSGYNLDAIPENATGTYGGGDYEQPITVTYRYCRKPAVVAASYLENGTNTQLATPYEHAVNYGDEYATHAKTITNYQLVSTIGDFESGIVNKDRIEVKYYYERKLGTLTVKYLDVDTNRELSPTERLNVKWGLTYQTTSKNIQNYYVFRIDGTESGTVNSDETEVVYYYKRSEGTLTVRYLDESTNGSIASNVVVNHYYGETYTTDKKVIPNYEFVRVSGIPTGIFSGNTTVIYYYRLRDSVITVRHLDIDDNHELFPNEVTNLKFGNSYTTNARTFTGYDFIKVEGPASGTVASSDLVVTYYYSRKTYNLTVRHLETGTNTSLADSEIRQFRYHENYTTLPKTITNYKVYQVPSNANGRIEGNLTITYYYAKKDGELVIRYVDEETNENIITPEITGVDFGEYYEAYSYADGRRMFENYDLVRVVGTEKGYIENELTTVTYYYRLKRGRVVTKYLDINNNAELLDSRQDNYKYGQSYSTIEETITGYVLDHVEGVTSGTFKGDVEVRYYYRIIKLTVTIHFKEEVTNNPVANDIIQNKNYGDRYTTSKRDIDNYLYTRVVGNERGTITDNVEVTYYYRKRDAKVIVKYIEQETNRALSPSNEIDYHWGDEYDTEPLDIDNYKVVEYPTNAYGVVDSDEIIVIYYYGHRDSVVVTKYLEDGTNREIASQERRGYNYGDNFVTYQKNIYSYEFVRSDGRTYGIVDDEVITVTYFYRKTTRTLTVKYLELDTEKKVSEDLIETMDYGTQYQTSRKILDDYDFYRVVGNESGKLEDNITVTYYYVRKISTLIVRHLDFETREELAREEVSTVRYGETYETHPKEIRYYIYNSVSGVPNGKIDTNPVVVEYYYIPRPSVVTSYYLDVSNNHEIADSEQQTVNFGEYYITKQSGGIPKNYEFLRKTPNYEGVATEDEIGVYYYYQKIDSNVETSINVYGTDIIDALDDEVSYFIEYKAKLKDYIGDGKITIIDTLPYGIYEDVSNLDDGIYNDSNHTITWEIDWNDIDTFENNDEIIIEKNIDVVYKGIKSTDRNINNNVMGKLTLDNNERVVEDDMMTLVKIYGTIIVHHYLEGTNNQLFLDEIIDGLVGDTYIIHEQEIEGFELVRRPLQETLTFEDEPYDVIYEYRRKRLYISVEVVGGIGTVTGDEEVLYEGNSTPNNIVITPATDYEIERITINDEEIEIDDPDGMTLDAFDGMYEDKIIQVSFVEKVISVPITGRNSNMIIYFIITTILVTIITAFIKSKKLKK